MTMMFVDRCRKISRRGKDEGEEKEGEMNLRKGKHKHSTAKPKTRRGMNQLSQVTAKSGLLEFYSQTGTWGA
jgi:hypothetical protein